MALSNRQLGKSNQQADLFKKYPRLAVNVVNQIINEVCASRYNYPFPLLTFNKKR